MAYIQLNIYISESRDINLKKYKTIKIEKENQINSQSNII